MERAKYIILNNNEPIVFSAIMKHCDVASAFASIWPGKKITSAGFLRATYEPDRKGVNGEIVYGGVELRSYGKSETLGIGRGDKDDFILSQLVKGL